MGLFAYKTFPKNSKVASYSGSLVPAAEAKDSQYAVAWRRGQVVDSFKRSFFSHTNSFKIKVELIYSSVIYRVIYT
jgi:hypothetical protein